MLSDRSGLVIRGVLQVEVPAVMSLHHGASVEGAGMAAEPAGVLPQEKSPSSSALSTGSDAKILNPVKSSAGDLAIQRRFIVRIAGCHPARLPGPAGHVSLGVLAKSFHSPHCPGVASS